MLGKLTKYEFKATYKTYLTFYVGILVLGVLNRIFLWINERSPSDNLLLEVPTGIFMLGYVLMCIALVVVTIFIAIQRFYKNLTGDEGYLMHTLPVKPWQLVISKLITAVVWSIASIFVFIVSLFTIITSTLSLSQIWQSFTELWKVFTAYMGSGQGVAFVVVTLLTLLLSVIYAYLTFYSSIAIGQMYPNKKLLASFAAYLLLNVVLQVFQLILTAVLFVPNYSLLYLEIPPAWFINSTMIVTLASTVVCSVICFVLTDQIFKKKLNLE